MRFGLLGPMLVEAPPGGAAVVIGSAKQRATLCLLALRAGFVCSVGELVEGLWGDDPPQTALKALQNYVSSLRRALPASSITTTPTGYMLAVEPADVDVYHFERAVSEGRRLAAGGDLVAAAGMLEGGLELWRGPALIDLVNQPLGRAEAAKLDELRLGAEEDLFDACLGLGQHRALVPRLEAAVAAQSLRERRWAQLMLALYRDDRQADALRTFQRLRAHLGEELGIEPSTELVALEEAIILQQPSLAWQALPEAPG
ncbi:MAG TPA: AfsR/SARP family transcriptional regulator, partial [Acidimicrobiales bacterium]